MSIEETIGTSRSERRFNTIAMLSMSLLTTLLLANVSPLQAQSSPLTVQPSTGRVGVGTTNPGYTLDVSGTVNATSVRGDGSQLTNLPGNAALNKVTTNTTVANTTAVTNLYSFSVPAGTLGTNNLLRLTMQITDLDLEGGSYLYLSLKYGATTLASVAVNNGTENWIVDARGLLTIVIGGDGATNAQIGSLVLNTNSSWLGQALLGQGSSAIDSTSAQTLSVTVSFSYPSSLNSITLGHAVLEKIS